MKNNHLFDFTISEVHGPSEARGKDKPNIKISSIGAITGYNPRSNYETNLLQYVYKASHLQEEMKEIPDVHRVCSPKEYVSGISDDLRLIVSEIDNATPGSLKELRKIVADIHPHATKHPHAIKQILDSLLNMKAGVLFESMLVSSCGITNNNSALYVATSPTKNYNLVGMVDGIMEDNDGKYLVEIKTRRNGFHVNDYDKVQVFIYMLMLGLKRCRFIEVLGPDSPSPGERKETIITIDELNEMLSFEKLNTLLSEFVEDVIRYQNSDKETRVQRFIPVDVTE